MKKMMFNIVTPIVSALSVFCMPLTASAQGPCCPPAPCCPQDECCDSGWSNAWILLGAAALGAGAGAAVAAAMNNKGKHGKHGARGGTGPTGPAGVTGPNVFSIPDSQGVLEFEFELTAITLGATGPGPVPFVETPDGHVYVGQPFSAPLVLNQTRSIFVDATSNQAPIRGTYHAGLDIGPATLAVLAFEVEVDENAPNLGISETTVLPLDVDVNTGPNYTQVTTEFTYDPPAL